MIQINITRKLFYIFNREEKHLFFLLILFQFLAAVLELISIGSLLPVFKFITDPEWNEKYFSFIESDLRVYFIFSAIILIFLIKSALSISMLYFTGKFRNKVASRVVNQVYSFYLNSPYEFHLSNNSAVLLRNMQSVGSIDSIIMRLVNFYADTILLLNTLILLFLVAPNLTFFILIFVVFILSFYAVLTKTNIKKYGTGSVDYNLSYLKNMMEGIKSFKEILLLEKQKFFSEICNTYKVQELRYKLKFSMVESFPRYILEIFFIVAILIGAIFLLNKNYQNLNEILPFLGVVIIGVFKISPNVLRIFLSIQQMKYLMPELAIVIKNLSDSRKRNTNLKNYANTKKIIFNKFIELRNVSLNYGEKKVLKNINLRIKKNSIISIQGSSGSGKSTLLNILTGLVSPSKGNIYVDGKKQSLTNKYWKKKIGFVSQNTHLIDDTICANISYEKNTSKINYNNLYSCINIAELKDFIESLPNKIDTIVGENGAKVSGGQAQRIGIARAFYNNPEILILDEPTNSLDSENEKKIIKTLHKLKNKITIIIVSHNLKPLEIAKENYLIQDCIIIKKNK